MTGDIVFIEPSAEHRDVLSIELIRAREAAGLTQAELADACGCTQSYIARLESAEDRQEVSAEFASRLIEALADASLPLCNAKGGK